ncbi:serine protease inhibitor I/II-like [Chelonus insularis]|uniref:serine protease inhibitor I/II-like n=1 Tax=Chelonus insularis TaxID=460826 RepID=UPI001588C069|nr:serine protease inhibitor I/II-like [Chelonus insularis]
MFAKTAVLFTIATVLIVGVYSASISNDDYIVVDEAPERCEVGRKYKVDCNTCTCYEETSLACTRMKCVHPPEKRSVSDDVPQEPWGPLWVPGTPCEPRQRFYSECNSCLCTPDGRNAVCTMKACFRPSVSA